MTDTKPALPDHLSTDPRSPFYDEAVLAHQIGIRFNGKQRFDVQEYCLSEGWIAIEHTRSKDRKGNPLLVRLKGQVEAFVDKCMSIDDLIDIHSTAIRRREDSSRYDFSRRPGDEDESVKLTRFKSKDYMDEYINPPAALKAEEERRKKKKEDEAPAEG